MSEHTPGPWTWGENFQGLYGSGEDNEVLCFYPYEGMSLNWRRENRDADACLIAAAPDLLDALLRLLNDGDVRDAAEKGALTQARTAIAKAEGAPK